MALQDIHQEYDRNYQRMIEIITQMGGDGNIKYHREMNTPLYQELRKLQLNEHRLSALEDKFKNEIPNGQKQDEQV